MLPHNLPPIPGKVYQFATSAGLVRFRVSNPLSAWNQEPYQVYPCEVVSTEANATLAGYGWIQLKIYSRLPGWVIVEPFDYPYAAFPEYPYTPCEEV